MRKTSYCKLNCSMFALAIMCGTPAFAGEACSTICHYEFATATDGSGQKYADELTDSVATSALDLFDKDFKTVVDKYERIDAVTERADTIKEYAGYASDIGGMAVPPGPWGGAVGLAEKFVTKGVDVWADTEKAAASNSIDQALGQILNNNATLIADMKTKTAEENYVTFFGADGKSGLFPKTTIGGTLSGDAKASLALVGTELLQSRLANVAAVVVKNDDQLRAMGKDINALRTNMDTYKTKVSGQFDNIKKQFQRTDAAVKKVANLVGNNAVRLDTVERMLFEQMPPKQRLDLISKGGLPGVKLSKEELDTLSRDAYIQEASEYAQLTSQAANDIGKIGTALGLNVDKEVEAVQKGAQLFQLGMQAMSGNPVAILSAAGGAAGLFGKQPGNPQQAVLDQINKLRMEMREMHKKTMAKLNALSQQIDARFNILMKAQGNTYQQLLFVSKVADELASEDILKCNLAADNWAYLTNESYDSRALRFSSDGAKDLASCIDGINIQFRKRVTVDGQSKAQISSVFLAHALRNPADRDGVNNKPADQLQIGEYANWLSDVYYPTFLYTYNWARKNLDSSGGCQPLDKLFTALTSSDANSGATRSVLKQISIACEAGRPELFRVYLNPAGDTSYSVDVGDVLSQPIDQDRVIGLTNDVLRAMQIYEFKGGGPDLETNAIFTKTQMLNPKNSKTIEGNQKLALRQHGLVADLLSMSIAQSTMYGGDIVIDHMATVIEKSLIESEALDFSKIPKQSWESCDADLKIKNSEAYNAFCLLNKNPVLAFNFFRYWTRSRLTAGGLPRYSAGMAYNRPAIIESAFTQKMPIVSCVEKENDKTSPPPKHRWCYQINYTGLKVEAKDQPANVWQYPLTDWTDMASSRLAYGSSYRNKLIALRSATRNRQRLLEVALFEDNEDARDLFQVSMVVGALNN